MKPKIFELHLSFSISMEFKKGQSYIIVYMKYTDQIKMLVLDVDGTMTDGKINVLESGDQFKQFNARDGLGIRMLVKKGVIVGIISHSVVGKAIEIRGKTLGVSHMYAGLEEKHDILEQWLEKMDFGYESVAFIGDDINDIPVMKKAAVSACPSDAVSDVLSYVDVVLEKKGGHGCVREFIDNYIGISYEKIK
ncbi:MAG: HAD hydrolase family protein [Reichenbachiella sp.]